MSRLDAARPDRKGAVTPAAAGHDVEPGAVEQNATEPSAVAVGGVPGLGAAR